MIKYKTIYYIAILLFVFCGCDKKDEKVSPISQQPVKSVVWNSPTYNYQVGTKLLYQGIRREGDNPAQKIKQEILIFSEVKDGWQMGFITTGTDGRVYSNEIKSFKKSGTYTWGPPPESEYRILDSFNEIFPLPRGSIYPGLEWEVRENKFNDHIQVLEKEIDKPGACWVIKRERSLMGYLKDMVVSPITEEVSIDAEEHIIKKRKGTKEIYNGKGEIVKIFQETELVSKTQATQEEIENFKMIYRSEELSRRTLIVPKIRDDQIKIDGSDDDWADIHFLIDEIGMARNPSGEFDVKRLWMAHDKSYLYILISISPGLEDYFQTKKENAPLFEIYLDIDDDSNTGSYLSNIRTGEKCHGYDFKLWAILGVMYSKDGPKPHISYDIRGWSNGCFGQEVDTNRKREIAGSGEYVEMALPLNILNIKYEKKIHVTFIESGKINKDFGTGFTIILQ